MLPFAFTQEHKEHSCSLVSIPSYHLWQRNGMWMVSNLLHHFLCISSLCFERDFCLLSWMLLYLQKIKNCRERMRIKSRNRPQGLNHFVGFVPQ